MSSQIGEGLKMVAATRQRSGEGNVLSRVCLCVSVSPQGVPVQGPGLPSPVQGLAHFLLQGPTYSVQGPCFMYMFKLVQLGSRLGLRHPFLCTGSCPFCTGSDPLNLFTMLLVLSACWRLAFDWNALLFLLYFPIMYVIIVPVQQQISCTRSVVVVTIDGDIQVKYSDELVCLEMV